LPIELSESAVLNIMKKEEVPGIYSARRTRNRKQNDKLLAKNLLDRVIVRWILSFDALRLITDCWLAIHSKPSRNDGLSHLF